MSGSDSIWRADLPWWERKVLPLGFVTLSFRQLSTMIIAFLAAFLVSFSFTVPIAGVSFGELQERLSTRVTRGSSTKGLSA